MKTKRVIEKLQDELRQRFRIAGPGAVAHVEDTLGLSTGYFRDQRRPDRLRLDLKVFFRALGALDVDVAELFTSVLGPFQPVKAFIEESRTMRQREHGLPPIFQVIAQREETATRTEVDLRALEEMARVDPAQARRELSAELAVAPDEQLPEVMAIYSSACLSLGKIDHAHMVLGAALELSFDFEETDVKAELLLQSATLASAQKRFDLALRLAEAATLEFITASDLPGIGKSLIHQGLHLRSNQKCQEALKVFERALFYLPETSSEATVLALRETALKHHAATRYSLGAAEPESTHGKNQKLPR